MPVTRASFLAEFPEFERAPTALVDAKLAAAELQTPEAIWGDLRDEGVKYLCAHLLAISPKCQDMALKTETGDNVYLRERKRLNVIVSSGYRVV